MMNELVPNRRVLAVDDNLTVLEDFRKILAADRPAEHMAQARAALFGIQTESTPEVSFELQCVAQGQEGYELARIAVENGRPFAVAFVDMRMPGGWDGLETIERLWEVDSGIQIVICTAFSDHPWDEIRSRVGQNDKLLILQKPFSTIEVTQLASALSRKWDLGCQVGRHVNELSVLVAERTAALQLANAELEKTVTQLKAAQKEIMQQNEVLEQLASRDPLTGCMNRRTLFLQFEEALKLTHERKTELSCVMVDIDRFKRINDKFGHGVGDQAIQAVARTLAAGLRLEDLVGRYGGEEFCLIFPNTSLAEAGELADRLRVRVENEAGRGVRTVAELTITISCGVASTALGAKTLLELVDQADKALYAAKEGGRNCVMVLEPIGDGANAFDQFEPQVRRITPRVSSPPASR